MTYQAVPPVQLWVWSLDEAQGAEAMLSDDERARAARMVVQLHAARFIAARAGLRRILGHCLGRDPAALAFALGPHGKPHLQAAPDLALNLSHSHHLAALVAPSDAPL